ncbi:MAG: NHL repeat-containing protein [Candidatus Eremiobacteraeota bacterium]|nr:NHL repeat-containing protein [Candidatus Eremiobacteraeota bacterium]
MRFFYVDRVVAIAVALLAGCAGAPTTRVQSVPQVQHRAGTQCPCLYVANAIYKGKTDTPRITVYAQGASGNMPPLQEIKGRNTDLDYPYGVAVDGSDNIYVANFDSSVTVYAAGATGNVAPAATISGSNTGLLVPQGIAINPVNADIYVSNWSENSSAGDSITFYAPGSNGNVSPLGVIQGPATQLTHPYGLTLDGNGNIYVALGPSNAIAVYAAGSTGDVAPIRMLQGGLTEMSGPTGVALDSNLNLYVANYSNGSDSDSLTVYAAGANGNVAPIQRIAGGRTKLDNPLGVAVDSGGNIYASNLYARSGNPSTVTVYAAGSNGNKAPIRKITGYKTGLAGPYGIVIH